VDKAQGTFVIDFLAEIGDNEVAASTFWGSTEILRSHCSYPHLPKRDQFGNAALMFATVGTQFRRVNLIAV
jgi:hypothetical protein